MANIFSGKAEKQIPQNLSDCTKQDATVLNLHRWAKRLEMWGKIVFYILISVGILSTVVEGITTYEYLEELNRYASHRELVAAGVEIPSVLDVVVSSIIKWAFFAVIEYCTYHAAALMISALASITQNTIITANVALYEASKTSADIQVTEPSAPEPISSDIPSDSPSQTVVSKAPPETMWVCKNCGANNSLNYGQCKKCGKFRT